MLYTKFLAENHDIKPSCFFSVISGYFLISFKFYRIQKLALKNKFFFRGCVNKNYSNKKKNHKMYSCFKTIKLVKIDTFLKIIYN